MIGSKVDASLLTEQDALYDSASTPPTQKSSSLAESITARTMGMLFQLLQSDPQHTTNAPVDALSVATLQGPRPDNQDRAAIAIISSPDGEPNNNIVCFLVADGVATLTNGAQCAALGISAFISAMVSKSHLAITDRVTTALNFANLQCFRRFRGRSGTTLSAAIVTQKELVTGNAGDSRIYGLFGDALRRLTVDDSMNERLAGQLDIDPQYSSSKGLLQYVGMGEGFFATVEAQSALPDLVLLTSDGFNQIPLSMVTAIILNAEPRRVPASV